MSKTNNTSAGHGSSPVFLPKSVQWTMLFAVVAGLLFIRPYFGAILFAGLIAFIFNPIYLNVLHKTKKQGLAITSAMVVAFLSVLLPVVFLLGITVTQANALISQFQKEGNPISSIDANKVMDQGTERANNIIHSLPGGEGVNIDKGKLQEQLRKLGSEAVQGFVHILSNVGTAAIGFISTAILAIFMISGMLRYQKELVNITKNVSPFHGDITQMYLDKAGAMTKAMVKGQLIIAICQGFASAFSLWVVGIDYFWFFLAVLTFLSFIPLGGGVITLPIGVVLMFTGNVPQGLFIILFHLLVVTNIDNLLRPRLVPKSARLHPALVLLAVFSGVAFFGAAGVIFGPVVMILIVATFEMYAEYNKGATRPAPPQSFKKEPA